MDDDVPVVSQKSRMDVPVVVVGDVSSHRHDSFAYVSVKATHVGGDGA